MPFSANRRISALRTWNVGETNAKTRCQNGSIQHPASSIQHPATEASPKQRFLATSRPIPSIEEDSEYCNYSMFHSERVMSPHMIVVLCTTLLQITNKSVYLYQYNIFFSIYVYLKINFSNLTYFIPQVQDTHWVQQLLGCGLRL